MSRIIEIKGCRDCPFVDTSPYDCYCSFICMKNSEIMNCRRISKIAYRLCG